MVKTKGSDLESGQTQGKLSVKPDEAVMARPLRIEYEGALYQVTALRRMITMTQPIQTITQFSQKSDARGTEVSYTYDSLNRVTATQFTDSTQNITYTYDSTSVTNGKGRLTGRTDSSGSYTFAYDVRGNLTQEDKTVSNVLYTSQYGYNLDNVLISITYPTGRVITYTPDVTGKITQVDTTLNGNPKTLASSITYYPYGGVGELTYGNGLSLSHGYDNQYRTSSITVGSILGRTYEYDANANITSISDSLMPSNGQGVEQARGYIYETGTNLLNDVWGGLSVVYDYDENGNTITENNRTFIYDLSNRLITVQDNSVTIAQYVYNALNQRVKKIVSSGTTIFHYDLHGYLIAETSASGQTLVEYFYLGDQPLAMIRPGEALYYYHNDHLGTPQILTNDSGTVSWKAVYTPFGEAVISVQTVENPIRFPGQYYDQETGLHYNWNRYYDPKTGRYLTPDPIGLRDRVSLWPFAENNPLALTDVLGLYAKFPDPLPPRINPVGPTPPGWGTIIVPFVPPVVIIPGILTFYGCQCEFNEGETIIGATYTGKGCYCTFKDCGRLFFRDGTLSSEVQGIDIRLPIPPY